MSDFKNAVAEELAKKYGFNTPTEEPAQEEQPAQESPQNAEPAKEEPAPQEQPKAEEPQEEQPNEWQQKYTGLEEEYNSLKSKLEELSNQDVFANEYIKSLNEKAKGGVNVESEDFWKWQKIDLDKYQVNEKNDALELVRMELENSNPNLSAEEIEYKIRKDYKSLFDKNLDAEDEDDKALIEDALMQLRIDAKSAIPKLKKYKEEIQLPKIDLSEKEAKEEAAKKAKEQYNLAAKDAVSNYSKESFKVGETELEYQPTEEDKKWIEAVLVDGGNLFSRYVNEDGSPKFDKAKREMLVLQNIDKLMKMAYDQGKSEGGKSVVDELENPDSSMGKGVTQQSLTPYQQALQQIAKTY